MPVPTIKTAIIFLAVVAVTMTYRILFTLARRLALQPAHG